MKRIDVNYVDLANIAELILKGGSVVEDDERYMIGFAKDLDIPVILQLSETDRRIFISVEFDFINEKIISFYMKGGIYAKIVSRRHEFMPTDGVSVELYRAE